MFLFSCVFNIQSQLNIFVTKLKDDIIFFSQDTLDCRNHIDSQSRCDTPGVLYVLLFAKLWYYLNSLVLIFFKKSPETCFLYSAALLGILYPLDQEAVYGAHLFYHFLFYASPTALRISSQICTRHLLQVQLGLLGLAMIGYYLLECMFRRTSCLQNNSVNSNPVLSLKDTAEIAPTTGYTRVRVAEKERC